ncbi:MAG: ATP-binding protein [Nostocales cyanobacterium LE14-WE4]|nr:ATP-binding protein [Anabaena sp. 49633_E8]MCE2700096.1 ATP-binding protein [Anabaena sp. 49633_E8]MDJ0499324.1 ATP-binding protein [Nostocales cyanobacterium LE14-WE4]
MPDNKKQPKYPIISYTHTLFQLSVNRKDPCEVIRELISNSYDAKASIIEIYPLLSEKGFIFFDNGTGLSEEQEINGITPYVAFFSIGKSTKIQGEAIGYKCQGSKLCFASKKVTIITRSQEDLFWRYKSIDNPKDNLNEHFDISSDFTQTPWDVVKGNFHTAKSPTVNIIKELDENFFTSKFNRPGTMIIVQGLEVNKFSEFYSSDDFGQNKYSYLKNYIKFNTRHGDMRILRPDVTGFHHSKANSFSKTTGYNDECKLYIWSKKRTKYSLQEVDAGYPYLEKPDSSEESKIKTPSQISRLNDGNFYARYCSTFSYEETTYCIVLAIDGNRRALKKYQELDRKGSTRSGVKLSDQRGVFISSEGVRICVYNEIFESSYLQDYNLLADSKAQSHYLLIINGSFDVVTNRNSLTDSSRQILKDELFIAKVKDFLDQAKVTLDLPYSNLWMRPRTFSGVGLDSIAVRLEENSLKDKVHRGLEYKYTFSPTDEYNHPFIVTNFIVCWDMITPEEKERITDSYGYFGFVSLTEELEDIGYEIINIESNTGEIHNENIKVISLKKLLDKTFECKWTDPN